jgi:hypothetical protein
MQTMAGPDEAASLDALRARDPGAIEALFESHADRIYRLANRPVGLSRPRPRRQAARRRRGAPRDRPQLHGGAGTRPGTQSACSATPTERSCLSIAAGLCAGGCARCSAEVSREGDVTVGRHHRLNRHTPEPSG